MNPIERLIEQTGAQPLALAGLAFAHLEEGRLEHARSTFDELAANDFSDSPADGSAPSALLMSTAIAHHFGGSGRAALLYDILLPYAEFQITPWGSVSRLDGLSLGRTRGDNGSLGGR